jgi:hypothetical protein
MSSIFYRLLFQIVTPNPTFLRKKVTLKSIPQKRLKIQGASWHPDSIDPMLALRILRADDWWDDFWNQRTEKLMAA